MHSQPRKGSVMRKFKDTFGGRRRKGQVLSSEEINHEKPSQSSGEDSISLHFPDGVEVLHDCPDATVDICFVHGLTGDRITTWTAQGQSDPWPKALLPSKFSMARILTYGYDAYVVRKSVAGSNRLTDHATNLLNDLTTDRDHHKAGSRPIIFVTHSLGGLICKKAILRSRNNPDPHLQGIFKYTKGVIFMGTPHKGSWMADWAKIPAGALGLVKSTNKSLLDILRTDNQLLDAIQVNFWSMIRELRESGRRIEVTCFFEELPLSVIGPVVSKDSATLEGYNLMSIHANHRDMVRFSSTKDNGFKRLLGELVRWESETRNLFVMDDNDLRFLTRLWPTDPKIEKKRIQETGGGLLEDVYRWVLENPDFRRWREDQNTRPLWIRGDPGKGKTMLVCGIIDELKKVIRSSQLLSFFFCQATDSRLNNATAVLRCLIHQLLDQKPVLISDIRERYNKYEDVNCWYTMSEILTYILENHARPSTFLILDGLDECQDGLPELLDMIMLNWSSHPHIKWIVSSRNWPSIRERLDSAEQLSLDLNAESISTAVEQYIDYRAHELATLKNYDVQTQNAIKEYLFRNANGTFLWVALVCQYLKRVQWNPLAKMKTFPPGLDSLYQRMMQEIRESEDDGLCMEILGFMVAAYRPIALQELASFSKILVDYSNDAKSLKDAVSLCGSFLTIREGTAYFVHQSAKEFLSKESSNELFPSGIESAHYSIFSTSLSNMKVPLRRDIYSLHNPGLPIDKVKRPDPDPLGAVQYSCIYWVDHLVDSRSSRVEKWNEDFEDGGLIEFLEKRYLHWLEALSLLHSTSNGILSMMRLKDLVQQSARPLLIDLVHDACQFFLYHKFAIENAPLQIYSSAILFSPTRSVVRSLFTFELDNDQWISSRPASEDDWSACLQTLEVCNGWVNSVAFSHDSQLLASGSDDRTIKVWEAKSGKLMQELRGHDHSVEWVTFSHDSKLLASASSDETIWIWDTSSMECLQKLNAHNGPDSTVAFSHDSKLLASGSDDKTIKVWEVKNGKCIQELEGYDDCDGCVTFSHDSKLLASASFDTIGIWNIRSGTCVRKLNGHNDHIFKITFSHDSRLLASGCYDETAKIWDVNSGKCIRTLEGHSYPVTSVAFSHDSELLASASYDMNINIWNTGNGELVQILEGHSNWVASVTFSHDSKLIASSSYDGTVKIWNANNNKDFQVREVRDDYGSLVTLVIFSPDSKLLASASYKECIKIWDTRDNKCLRTLRGHSKAVKCLTFSHDSKLLISGSADETIKIWDTSSEKCLKTLEGHSNSVNSVALSHDSKTRASASWDKTLRVWDVSNAKCFWTFMYHDGMENLVAFSHDSRLLASSDGRTIRMWDTSSWDCVRTFEGHELVSGVTFSHDSKLLASASDDKTIRIWDNNNGNCLQTFKIGRVCSVISFDISGSYLSTEIGTIDVSSTLNITPIERPPIQEYGISCDGMWIMYKSTNLLWLPSEYRPSCSAVAGSTVAIGCASGRVLILNFETRSLQRSLAQSDMLLRV